MKSASSNFAITVLAAAAIIYPISVATYSFGTNKVSLVFQNDSVKLGNMNTNIKYTKH